MVVIGRDGTQKKPVAEDIVIEMAILEEEAKAKQAASEAKAASSEGKKAPRKPKAARAQAKAASADDKRIYKWFVGRRGVAMRRRYLTGARVCVVLQAALMLVLSMVLLQVVGLDDETCGPLVEDGRDEAMAALCRMTRFLAIADMTIVHGCILVLMVEVYAKGRLLRARRG